jgi:signal peptidase II
VFLGIAGTVVVLDQIAKAWLVANVSPGEVVEVLGDWVRLIFSQNSGALFGLFRDNAVLFGIVSLAVIGLIVAYHGRAGRSLYMSIALGLLLGGAIGNLVDRLRIGYVVDFIDIGIGDWRFYTFNLADSAISLAIVLLIGAALFPVLTRLGERPADG